MAVDREGAFKERPRRRNATEPATTTNGGTELPEAPAREPGTVGRFEKARSAGPGACEDRPGRKARLERTMRRSAQE
jgi:hypothetical protein